MGRVTGNIFEGISRKNCAERGRRRAAVIRASLQTVIGRRIGRVPTIFGARPGTRAALILARNCRTRIKSPAR
jgi:hypothetical protein